MQHDRSNWIRTIRDDKKQEVLEFEKRGDDSYELKTKIGEKWSEGASYFKAFKNAYARVGTNLGKFSQEDGQAKLIAIPLYSAYIILYSTLVPLYPILGTLDEAKKLMEPIY